MNELKAGALLGPWGKVEPLAGSDILGKLCVPGVSLQMFSTLCAPPTVGLWRYQLSRHGLRPLGLMTLWAAIR